MKTKKSISILLSVLLALAFGAVLWLGLAPSVTARAEEEWSSTQIEEEYAVNSEFAIPSRTVTVNGQTAEAQGVLVYPDGTATLKSPAVLDQTGTYSVNWSAEVGGQPYAAEQPFYVYNPILSYGEGTTVEYGVPHTAKTEGMLVHLAQGDTLTFMQYIDVADLQEENYFAEFYVYPTTEGVADMDAIVFTLTDSQDPDIYVKIRGHRYIRCPGMVYYSAGFSGGPMKGYEADKDILHVDDEWGMAMAGSFEAMRYDWNTGISNYEDSDRYINKLSFDASGNGVYGECGSGSYGGQIIDLDSPSYFEDLFGGFPSGKVFLSVSGEGFNSATANICFTKVLGTDITDYDGVIADNEPPVITIENPYTEMPEARVGGIYPVFAASAEDIYSGECEVKASVWYNYMTDDPVRIDTDGTTFRTERTGWYAIVYTSTDKFGKTASETLWVHAGGPIDEMRFTVTEEDITGKADLGSWVEVPAASDALVTGGSGNITIGITVTHGGETYEISDGFRPETTGKWVVEYTATDITGKTARVSFTVDAKPGDAPVLTEEPVLPNIFIAGSPYIIPEAYATDYSSGAPDRILLDVRIEDANGSETYSTGSDYTPHVAANGDTVKLTYLCDGKEVRQYEVPAILAFVSEGGTSRLHVENYFYGTNVGTDKTESGIILSAADNASAMRWMYANTLAAEFSMNVSSVPGSSAFGRIVITLIDAQNKANAVSAQLQNGSNGVIFSAGGSSLQLEQSFMSSSEQSFTVGFSGTDFLINGVRFPVGNTDGGAAFSGFSSGLVWLQIEMQEVTGAAAYKIASINNYPFTEVTRDLVAPNIVLLSDYGGSYAIGDIYTIGRAVAADVLSPRVDFTLTVRDPQGNVVRDVNGVLLENADPGTEYSFEITQLGQYQVSYTAAENEAFTPRPNTARLGFVVNVEDSVPPEITFGGSLAGTAKVGDTIVLPSYTVTDNMTAAEEIAVSVFVLNPNGVLIPMSGNSFTPSYAGVYEFRIVAMDSDGNSTMVRLAVTVTAE